MTHKPANDPNPLDPRQLERDALKATVAMHAGPKAETHDDLAARVAAEIAADPAIATWKAEFTDRILAAAQDNPLAYLEMLCANARHFPQAIPLFAHAMTDMADVYFDEACKLDMLAELKRQQGSEAQS
ncbi:hypothetical protein ACFPOB_15955 [Bosea eneae]|uniref:Uncharacterized protein n=1 Tax=Bosea eneae TaxID=151454 RepID=A0ABW0IRW2_9HYPH